VDWLNSELIVERAISRARATDGVHKYQQVVGTTKGGRSRRVGLAPMLLEGLRHLRATVDPSEGSFIFMRNGTFIDTRSTSASGLRCRWSRRLRRGVLGGSTTCAISTRRCSSPKARIRSTFRTAWTCKHHDHLRHLRAPDAPGTPRGIHKTGELPIRRKTRRKTESDCVRSKGS
jgi:hypothetical protein